MTTHDGYDGNDGNDGNDGSDANDRNEGFDRNDRMDGDGGSAARGDGAGRKPMHTGMVAPKGRWWVPAHKSERVWFTIAFAWCMVLFAMMPLWHWKGGQNASGIRSKVDPDEFMARVEQFVEDYRVGTFNGFPLVEPPPGSDIYLVGRMWSWYPVLKLTKGVEYTLHLSSTDVNHGFSLYPVNINFQVVPGYDYGLKIVPTEAGEFGVICNEFCGFGHHIMLGKVLVTNEDGTMPGETAAAAEEVN